MDSIKIENARELKEIYEILKFFPQNELSKISKKFLNFIEKNKDNAYNFIWDENKEFNENTVLPGTITLMQMIFLDYFASEEEKKEINRILDENEQKFQKEIDKKYNPNSIFKMTKNNTQTQEEVKIDNQMVIYKENIFKKILISILNIFRRRKKNDI